MSTFDWYYIYTHTRSTIYIILCTTFEQGRRVVIVAISVTYRNLQGIVAGRSGLPD